MFRDLQGIRRYSGAEGRAAPCKSRGVLALLGENGAGKSNLMKAIIGLHQPDSGTMTFEGKPYSAKSPVDAMNAGISMIHQELNPEPHLTIAQM